MRLTHIRLPVLLLLGALAVAACGPQAQEPRNLTALAGAGQDTITANAFFPSVLRIRAGDTVTWKINSDEIHTVSFANGIPAEEMVIIVPIPGGGEGELMLNPNVAFPTRPPDAPAESYSGEGFVSSGILSKEPDAPDAPPNDSFTLTFDTPGTYAFICLIHEEFMQGTVVVEPATATDVPSQEEIDAQAKAEMDLMLGGIEVSSQVSQAVRSEPGPGDTTFWFVKAGVLDFVTADPRGEAMEFLPEDLTVTAGDTVIWGSSGVHTVTFTPAPPPPEFIVPLPQEGGPPILSINPQLLIPSKPDALFDPTKFYHSGLISFFVPDGVSWALTFEEPGTYEYFCALHRELGMEGTITVVSP